MSVACLSRTQIDGIPSPVLPLLPLQCFLTRAGLVEGAGRVRKARTSLLGDTPGGLTQLAGGLPRYEAAWPDRPKPAEAAGPNRARPTRTWRSLEEGYLLLIVGFRQEQK